MKIMKDMKRLEGRTAKRKATPLFSLSPKERRAFPDA